MIGLPPGAHVWLAAGATDMRNGFDGLAAIVKTTLSAKPPIDRGPSSCARLARLAIHTKAIGGTMSAIRQPAHTALVR